MALASQVRAYSDLVDQFVNDASFLWVLRSVAQSQPHYAVADLYDLELRLQKQLDGLFVDPELAWELLIEALVFEEPGEVFVSAVFAFRSHDVNHIKTAVDVGLLSDDTRPGLVSALAWLPLKLVKPWLNKFYQSKDFDHKKLALEVSIARREDPQDLLNKILSRDDCLALESLYAEALHAVGVFKRSDLIQYIVQAVEHENSDVKFRAIWAAAMLGDRQYINDFQPYVMEENVWQKEAIQLAFRCLPSAVSKTWISELIKQSESPRNAIKAVAALGDPEVAPWLIGLMQDSTHSRIAAEAFSLITGIDIEANDLAFDLPDLEEAMPEEEDSIALDEDENLAWPNADKIQAIWQKYGKRFQVGSRYLMGKEICSANHSFFEENTQATSALKKEDSFLQRQRHAAALELALAHPSIPYINTSAKVLS